MKWFIYQSGLSDPPNGGAFQMFLGYVYPRLLLLSLVSECSAVHSSQVAK
jgi:hypothetical protein